MPFPPTPTNLWDTTQPPDTQLASMGAADFRNLKTDIMQRLSLLSGTFANRPTPEIANAVWGGAGYGLLYFAIDTGQVFQWSGAAWVDVSSSIGPTRLPTVGGILLAPIAASSPVIWRAPFACTVTHVRGYVDGATGSVINATHGGLALLTANLTLGVLDTWIDGGAVQNTAVVAGDSIGINLVSVLGAPTYVAIQVEFTRP